MLETKSIGFMQGDILVRTAIIKGLRELRANPKLLQYCFAWLPNDTLTAEKYGTKTVEYATKWFLGTEILVRLDVAIDQVKLPCITISLSEAQETQATLGDINYDPADDVLGNKATNLESVVHRESYNLGIYVQGEPEQLLFLYSIVVFLLYRYKKTLLEARGFEISTMTGGKMTSVEVMDRENVFGRPISLTGFVRHYWPATTGPKIEELQQQTRIITEELTPKGVLDETAGWFMEKDLLDAQRSVQFRFEFLTGLTTLTGILITDLDGQPITV